MDTHTHTWLRALAGPVEFFRYCEIEQRVLLESAHVAANVALPIKLSNQLQNICMYKMIIFNQWVLDLTQT